MAAGLRLGWLGVNSFAFDEARLSLISLEMAQNGVFARVGMPSSAGVPNLPAAAWVFSLPYFFSTDPLVATQFVGLLSMATVAATWWLARRVWGRWAGLIALLYIAASPYGVLYSRSIWAQNLLPVLALGWGWTAFLGATRHKRWAIGLHVFLAGFAFQVHFAGAGLVIGTAYFFLRFRWRRWWLPVLLGGGLALLTLLPFAAEIACCRPDILDQYRTALGHEPQYDLLGFLYTAYLGLGMNWHYLLLGDLHPFRAMPLAIGAGLLLLAGFAAVIKILVGAYRRLSQETPAATHSRSAILAEIVLIWLVSTPLFFLRHTSPVFIHYQLAALPALALLAGAGVKLLMPQLTESVGESFKPSPTPVRRRAILGGILVFVTLVVALGWGSQLAQGLDVAGEMGTPNGLGTPLRYTRYAAYDLPGDDPVLLFAHGDDPNLDGEAAVFEVLWWGRTHRIVQGESLLILPRHPAWLMATLKPFQAWEELQDLGLAQESITFPRREGLLPYIATYYDDVTEPAGFTMIESPIMLADGAQLEGWKARMVGPRMRISTLWRVVGRPPAAIYQQFHHLRTEDTLNRDQPATIADVPVSAHDWQVGDRLVVMGDFFVDDAGQQFWVDVGHYTLPDLQRVARRNGADGRIRLGPFSLAPN